jgi:uncharacterized membrane protein
MTESGAGREGSGMTTRQRAIWQGSFLVGFFLSMLAMIASMSNHREPTAGAICLAVCVVGLAVTASGKE